MVSFLEKRAYGALETNEQCEQRRDHLRRPTQRRRAKSAHGPTQRLRRARAVSDEAVALVDDVTLLVDWFRHDILAVAGLCYTERRQLYDFVVAELKAHTSKCPHRLEPICRDLENQRDDLLAFARRLDENLEQLGQELQIPAELVRCVLKTLSRDERAPRRWAEEAAPRKELRGRFHAVQFAVGTLAEGTVRASSLVESLNSRLRSYFFLRRHLGLDYLALLQFYLNHRRLERSDRPQRVGKTPAELLTGQSHRHWLEMLGYTRFSRA